jgi:uncharacterized protein (DUF2236 family)
VRVFIHPAVAPGDMAVTQRRASSRFTESYEFFSSDFTRLTGSLDSDAENAILNSLEQFQQMPRILQEGILLTGGGVAILLQAAAHGIAPTATKTDANGDVKTLAEQLYQSIHEAMVYLYGLTFGTREQRKRILGQIYSLQQQQQQQVNGNAEDAAAHVSSFSEDPKLRLWIAATLYATGTEMYQRVFEKLSVHEAERAYKEFTVLVNIALNVPKGLWPINRGAFWAYWDENVEKLDVDTRARPVVHDLEALDKTPGWLKVSMPFIRHITPEMLPAHVREQYGFQSSSTSRFMYKLYMGGARAIYPALPGAIRSIPKKRAMKEVEEMLREQ